MTGLADTGNGMFRLTGPWMPAKAGMASIFAPHTFAARLREQTAVTVAVICTAATATTTTTQVMVQAAATTARHRDRLSAGRRCPEHRTPVVAAACIQAATWRSPQPAPPRC